MRPVKAKIRSSSSPSAAATDEDSAAKPHTSASRHGPAARPSIDTVFDIDYQLMV